MPQSDLRLDFAALLADTVDGCGDRVMVAELPSLHSTWTGEVPLSPGFRDWYLDTFLGAQEAARAKRAVRVVRRVFLERNAARFEATGEPQPLPDDLIEELERRVLTALYPSCYQIAAGATRHPADQVSRGLAKLGASEAKWRKRY